MKRRKILEFNLSENCSSHSNLLHCNVDRKGEKGEPFYFIFLQSSFKQKSEDLLRIMMINYSFLSHETE